MSFAHGMGWREGVFWFLLFSVPLAADVPLRSSRVPGKVTVYALEQTDADTAAMQVEEILQKIHLVLTPEIIEKPIPLVMVIQDDFSKGDPLPVAQVHVFRDDDGYKVQVNWDQRPISRESLIRGTMDGWCVRHAIQLKMGIETGGKAHGEVRIPWWIPVGIGAILEDAHEDNVTFARSSIMARVNPDLSWKQVRKELEKTTLPDRYRIALAHAICSVLLENPKMKEKMILSLHVSPEVDLDGWMKNVTGRDDLDKWWEEAWKGLSLQFTWGKVGYLTSLRWIMDQEARRQGTPAPESGMPPDLGSLVHPWFSLYLKTAPTLSLEDARKLRKDIQFRRSLCLEWMRQLESRQASSREDFVLWNCLYGHFLKGDGKGPAGEWLDEMEKKR